MRLESSSLEPVAAGELGVRALGAAECHLHRAEALGLDPVGSQWTTPPWSRDGNVKLIGRLDQEPTAERLWAGLG